jgi:hypothetical protein
MIRVESLQAITRSSFTLIETVLALFVIVSLAMMGSFEIRDYQSKNAEEQALKDFESCWENALNYSFLTNHEVEISGAKHQITFYYQGHRVSKVDLPETLEISHLTLRMNGDGGVQPKTIKFFSRRLQGFEKTYKYTVQMNWGVLNRHEKKGISLD